MRSQVFARSRTLTSRLAGAAAAAGRSTTRTCGQRVNSTASGAQGYLCSAQKCGGAAGGNGPKVRRAAEPLPSPQNPFLPSHHCWGEGAGGVGFRSMATVIGPAPKRPTIHIMPGAARLITVTWISSPGVAVKS